MGWCRAWIAVVPLGIVGTAAAQTGAPASSGSFPPAAAASAPAGSSSASAASPSATATAPVPAPTSTAPAAPSAAPSPGAPQPPGYPPYPYPPYPYPPHPYPPPYYYPYPPPYGYYEPPKDTRPRTLPYVGGQPAPPGYHVESGVRRGPVIAGSLMFGITYGLQALVTAGNGFEEETDWLLVPVLGSWVYMSEVCDRGSDDGCTLLALHGLTQTAGAALLIYGLASTNKRYVRDEISVRLAPARFGSGYGFSANGRF